MKQLNTVKYVTNNLELDILIDYEKETVWLNQEQITLLFETSKSNISEHIGNVLKENLLIQSSTVRNFRTVASFASSPSSKICLMCSLTFDLLVWYSSHIWACVSHRVSSSSFTSIFVLPSLAVYMKTLFSGII